jgi:DNA (cytosine-5)-methyltransferase 1
MKWLEMYAGAGGAACGIRAAGGDSIACLEWDSAACETLRAAGLPAVEGDVRDWLRSDEVVLDPPEVGALWSSFPCQVWSQAGTRDGPLDDDRNGWPATVEAVDRLSPRWFIAENVRGLTHHVGDCSTREGGEAEPERCARCYFELVILGDLRARFVWVDWRVVDSADFGVPQHRRRVFIVAGPRPFQWPTPTHAEPDSLLVAMGRSPWRTMGEALGLRPGLRVLGGGTNPRESGREADRTLRDLTDEPSTTIAAQSGGGAGNAGPFVVRAFERQNGVRGTTERSLDRPAPTMLAGSHRDNGLRIEFLQRPAPTVTAQEQKGTRASQASGWQFNGGPDRASDALFAGTGRRRLTIAECAVLQSFPPWWPFQGNKGEQYRQIGNAVPPPIAELLARAVHAADQEAP